MASVVVLGMNRFGEKVYEYLVSHDETEVMGAFTEESQYEIIQKIEPDYIVSAGFDHIIPDTVLRAPTEGAINLHPSYLPYNRGVNPDIWSIMRDEKAGVSIHQMTPEMDEGPIISQREIDIRPDDTARTLRKRLDEEIVDLFIDEWEKIYTNDITTKEQESQAATYNYSTDFEDICEIELDEEIRADKFLNKLRALTFPPYYNAYFQENGEKYYVRVSITSEDDIDMDEFEWDTPTLF